MHGTLFTTCDKCFNYRTSSNACIRYGTLRTTRWYKKQYTIANFEEQYSINLAPLVALVFEYLTCMLLNVLHVPYFVYKLNVKVHIATVVHAILVSNKTIGTCGTIS